MARGDPESPLRWTSKSTRALSAELLNQGFKVSQHKVGEMLGSLGYSLQSTSKMLEGESHPDRDGQFRHINSKVKEFQAQGQPVVSVDTKKKELIGASHNHSARTTRIVREIARITKPDGEARVMVYNREGTWARAYFLRAHLLGGRFLNHTFDETLWAKTDGFSARCYVREQFEDLFRGFFEQVGSEICGQEEDAVPLPRLLRRVALRLVPEDYLRRAEAQRGSFIFLKASRPR